MLLTHFIEYLVSGIQMSGGGLPLPIQSSQTNSEPFRYSGSELVMLYDYKVKSFFFQICSESSYKSGLKKMLKFISLSYFEPFSKWCMCRPRPQTTCLCGEETGSTPTSTTRRWMAGCGPTLPRRENTDLYLKRTLDHQP